jgi:uncharacterized protein YlzI (FlbEa/FlbD family)
MTGAAAARPPPPLSIQEDIVIVLHRLTHPDDPFHLNPDAIHMIEAHPDTVIVLSSGSKLVVLETPEEVAQRKREWHASILRLAAGTAPVVALPAR